MNWRGKSVLQFNDSSIVTKTVSVETHGCEQVAQSRYAAAPWPGLEITTSSSQVRLPPLRHHATPCYSNGSDSRHCHAVTPLVRSVGCVRRARRLDASIAEMGVGYMLQMPFSVGEAGPPSITHGFMSRRESTPQTAYWSVHSFLQDSRLWPTYRQTDHATPYIGISHILLAMLRCGLTICASVWITRASAHHFSISCNRKIRSRSCGRDATYCSSWALLENYHNSFYTGGK